MKRFSRTSRDLFWLVLVGAVFVVPVSSGSAEDDTGKTPDLSRYEQSEAFKSIVAEQSHAGRRLLAISSFLRSDRVTLQYSVNQDGRETDWRNVYNWAVQASSSKQLTKDELKQLTAAIDDLPAENATPPIERLVIVSFRHGDQWLMRSYDRNELPKAMRRIYEIIGERFESKPAK